jgi:hypothetical protein
VGAALAANLAGHRQRVAAMAQEFDSLNRQFECAGVEYAVWKGFALIPEYCPDACLRPSYDYDYLISADACDGAQKVLQAAGYIRKPEPRGQVHLTFAPRHPSPRHSLSPCGLYAAAIPRKVELHLGPWDEEIFPIPLRLPHRPSARRVRRTWQGLSFYSLEEPETFVFQAIHTFQHILDGWCRLGWLLEIAYFLESRSTDTSFWKKLKAYLEANELLAEVVALVISLASGLFHATLPAPIKGQILGTMRAQVSLWVDHYGLRSALGAFSENKYALFLYREFLRDESVWRQIRRGRLLPLHWPQRALAAAAHSSSPGPPGSWRQAWHVVQRLIYHLLGGAAYIWESSRWERIKARARPPRLSSV